jgi:hypothetical protein
VLVLAGVALAQSDRGTITGTVTDPAGAVITGAAVKAKNTATGVEYPAGTSNTGNYVLAQLPTGPYELTVSMSGFKTYVRTGITVIAAQTLRIDVALEIGALTETVSVNAEAAMLKTESGELSHNIEAESLDQLPILSIGSTVGQTGIRNPLAVMEMLPGADWSGDATLKLNGMVSNAEGILVEGQDSTNNLWQQMAQYTQMGVDAIQEFAVEASNYAAEFGAAGGSVFNITMKSGTNAIHGSAYEYFVNEALNAGTPFTEDGTGAHLRPISRRNDFGFTFGGPVYLPGIYNGKDKLFFFFNFEEYRQSLTNNNFYSVPTTAMQQGNFNAVEVPVKIGTSANGNPIYWNEIFDPKSAHLVNGVTTWNSFASENPGLGNVIPVSRMDPAALAVQSYFPQPSGPNASSNYQNALVVAPNDVLTWIPSVKVDYSLSPKAKISGFWSRNYSLTPFGADGLAPQISAYTPITFENNTVRLNFDYTLQPTMMLHLGVGLIQNTLFYDADGHNPQADLKIPGGDSANPQFGLLGMYTFGFGGFTTFPADYFGLGAIMDVRFVNLKPTANPSFSWIKGNHNYKFGASLIVESDPSHSESYHNNYYFQGSSWQQTADPSFTLSGGVYPSGLTPGFNYASFLLGASGSDYTNAESRGHLGDHSIAFYAQDSWKITRKITLDYGLRYDFQTYLKEEHGRMGSWSPTAYNPEVGLPGAIEFEGYGPGHCNCEYGKNYPYAFGPRLGLAWQLAPKTVLRAGAGLSYGTTSEVGYINNMMSNAAFLSSPGANQPVAYLSQGIPASEQVTWPNTYAGQFPHLPSLDAPPVMFDPNSGRPARIFQWSFGLQREITKSLLLDVTYLGNRGAWWPAPALRDYDALTPQFLQSRYNLNVANASDRALLTSSLATVQGMGPSYAARFPTPFAGFPMTDTLAQALAPFPQGASSDYDAPLGRTWYDSLQVKLTKRFAHNLSFDYNFTYAQNLYMGGESSYFYDSGPGGIVNDVMTRSVNKYISGLSRPWMNNLSVSYITPRVLRQYKPLSWLMRDWQYSALLRYSAAYPIEVPQAVSNIATILHRTSSTTFANRTGQPFFENQNGQAINLNCHCFDPSTTFVLNPAAWTEPASGAFGTSTAYYNNYRGFRYPTENMGLARNFPFGRDGRANLQLRAEFNNIFNRLHLANPSSTTYGLPQTTANGLASSGFGYINVLDPSTAANVRQGQIVARFSF